jgi:hypothetical protein
MKNDSETNALTKSFLSKQQENNERLINDQEKLIDSLKLKYKQLEAEFNKSNKSNNGKFYKFLKILCKKEIDFKFFYISRKNVYIQNKKFE